MNVRKQALLEFLEIPDTQLVIPVYQRVYSWTARQCEVLWGDVARAGEEQREHFAGVVLCAQEAESWGCCGRLRIIDGQQRCTTVTLLLIAIRNALASGALAVDGLCASDLDRRYLRAGSGDDAPCKLVLSHLDRCTLATLVDGGAMPDEHSARLVENLRFFEEKLAQPGLDAGALWRGLQRLTAATALLDGAEDPQAIFESLNSRGLPLTAADLVRNALLFGEGEGERRVLYERCWRPLEEGLAGAPGATMDGLVRAWLAARFRDERVRSDADVYGVLREYLRVSGCGVGELLDELARFGSRYAGDEEWRAQADRSAREWLEDKPRATVGEFKLFGD